MNGENAKQICLYFALTRDFLKFGGVHVFIAAFRNIYDEFGCAQVLNAFSIETSKKGNSSIDTIQN